MTKLKPSNVGSEPTPLAKIIVLDEGPYLLYGKVPFSQQFILPDALGESWYYQRGESFTTSDDPTHPTLLCRCGHSKNTPYCDSSHESAEWDAHLTALPDRLLDNVQTIESSELTLTDNERYCCYARFCHPGGSVWRLAQNSESKANRDLAIREASMCPSARLMAWRRGEELSYEFDFEPSLSLLEDPEAECSAGLWLRGGIAVERADGVRYEVRNRVVLCRCGESGNKPYCDGTHASAHWRDALAGVAKGEELPDGELEICEMSTI